MSEKTFGAILQRGYDIHTHTSSYQGFLPPRDEDKPENQKILLDSITEINAGVIKCNDGYTDAVATRQNLFNDSPTSMTKLLALIIGAVVSQYNKNSVEHKLIAGIVKKIRSSRVEKAPKPDDPNAKEKISQSTRSYGSQTQLFNDIITTLGNFTPAYAPSNTAITLTALKALAKSMTDSNAAVASTFGARSKIIENRLAKYKELRESTGRIKAYTKSQYGVGSNEFKLIKGIEI